MKVEQIDQELLHWRQRLELASENLRGFADLPAFQWAASGAATGRTAARLADIAGVMDQLQSYLGLLTGTIDRAASLRAGVAGSRASAAALDEIDRLLQGPSIQLTAGPTPPEQRELLRPVQVTQAMAPRDLLAGMLESFRLLRDVVLEVGDARSKANAMADSFERQLAEFRSTNASGVAEVQSQVLALRALVDSDPLEALSRAAAVGESVTSARLLVSAATARETSTRTKLAEASRTLQELQTMHQRACAVAAERAMKVQDADLPEPGESGEIASMAAWLGRLEQTAREGKWGPASIGLDRWRQEAERRLAADQAVIRTAESALNRRRDLRGLMDALAAKAQALGRARDPELSTLAGQAFELLGRRPTPMAQARQAVKEYESRLL
jgi:hypothetical protein